VVFLLGDAAPVLDGSEYQKRWYGGEARRPAGRIPDVDLDAEVALQGALRAAIAAGLLRSAHDCSDGGLAVALAESCMAGGLGADLTLDDVPWVGGSLGCAASAGAAEAPANAIGPLASRPDLALFGETPTLAVVSAAVKDVDRLEELCEAAGVPSTRLGTVGGSELVVTVAGRSLRADVAVLEGIYESAIPTIMGE
jgi:phosphoribosylformylglycinamidine synthase